MGCIFLNFLLGSIVKQKKLFSYYKGLELTIFTNLFIKHI